MKRPESQLRWIARLGAWGLRVLGPTLRVDVAGAEAPVQLRASGSPVIYAFWHAWILPLAYLHREEGVVVLVSEHGDGETIARVIHRMGFETTRGSSTRGGFRGTRGLVRALAAGRSVAITPDGPRGPARDFKPGALVAAQLSGSPVVPVAVEAPTAWRLRSWDGFAIPRPFGKIQVRYGPPRTIPREADADALDVHAQALAAFMNHGAGG